MCDAHWFLLLYLLLAALWDVSLYRVPNRLTALAWLTGFGLVRSPAYLLSGAAVLLLFFLPARLGMLGGGDAKLFAAAASFLGGNAFLQVLLFTFLAASAVSLVKLIRHRILLYRFRYFCTYIARAAAGKRLTVYRGPDRELARLPLAAAAFAGYLFYLIKLFV